MNPKIASGVATALTVVAIVFAVVLMKDRDEQRRVKVETQAKLKSTEETLATTKMTLATTEKNLADKTAELDTTKTTLATTEKNLADKTAEADKLTADLKTTSDDLAATKGELEKSKTDLAAAKKSVDELTAKTTDLTTQLADLTKVKSDLEEKNRYLEAKINVDKTTALPEGLTGKILAVDHKWQFVVLGVGRKAGALPGGRMIIGRADQSIGTVRIVEVLDDMAIADITSLNDPQLPVGVGDTALAGK